MKVVLLYGLRIRCGSAKFIPFNNSFIPVYFFPILRRGRCHCQQRRHSESTRQTERARRRNHVPDASRQQSLNAGLDILSGTSGIRSLPSWPFTRALNLPARRLCGSSSPGEIPIISVELVSCAMRSISIISLVPAGLASFWSASAAPIRYLDKRADSMATITPGRPQHVLTYCTPTEVHIVIYPSMHSPQQYPSSPAENWPLPPFPLRLRHR